MRQVCIMLALALFALSRGGAQEPTYPWLDQAPRSRIATVAGEVPVVDFSGLKPLLEQKGSNVRIVNFWATWCAPCIAELPHFERLREAYASKGVEVTLVSLDMPAQWEERLPAFIEKRGIRSPVVVLDDPRQNDWIPKVSEKWSGAIPATLIYTDTRREFYEKSFDGPGLEAVVKSFLHH